MSTEQVDLTKGKDNNYNDNFTNASRPLWYVGIGFDGSSNGDLDLDFLFYCFGGFVQEVNELCMQ